MDFHQQSKSDQSRALEVAVATIEQEHRTLGTVLSALQQWLAKVAKGHAEPDFGFFTAALYYIHDFPERYHHPKEDEHLFKVMRCRTNRFDAAIDALQAEHASSAQMIAHLEHALVHYQGGGAERTGAIQGRHRCLCRDAARSYAQGRRTAGASPGVSH